MAVLAESKRVSVIEHTFWVMPTIRNSYAVAERLIREIDRPNALFYSHGQTLMYGEFKRRDHAYRWCAALQRSDNARETRSLTRWRKAEAAAKDAA